MFRQVSGGPIGLRATGVVARIVMDRWERNLTTSLRLAKLEVYLLGKYVDYVNGSGHN